MHGGWKIVKRYMEKKQLTQLKRIKVRSVEIQVSDTLRIKVMSSKDLFRD